LSRYNKVLLERHTFLLLTLILYPERGAEKSPIP